MYLLVNLLNGITYDVIVSKNTVYVNTSSDGLALLVGNVTGQPLEGNNTITKQNGIIYLNH